MPASVFTSWAATACLSRPTNAWKSTSLFSSRRSALTRLFTAAFLLSFFDLKRSQPPSASALMRKRYTIFFIPGSFSQVYGVDSRGEARTENGGLEWRLLFHSLSSILYPRCFLLLHG